MIDRRVVRESERREFDKARGRRIVYQLRGPEKIFLQNLYTKEHFPRKDFIQHSTIFCTLL